MFRAKLGNIVKTTFLVVLICLAAEISVGFAFWAKPAYAQDTPTWVNPVQFSLNPEAADFGKLNPAGLQPRHTGVDFISPMGTEVHAVADGRVVWAGWWPSGSAPNGHGLSLWIYHGAGSDGRPVYSVYAYLAEFKVSVGDWVSQNQVVAMSGETGYGTGPHLHFAVGRKPPGEANWQFSDWDNPNKYLGKSNPLDQEEQAAVEFLLGLAKKYFWQKAENEVLNRMWWAGWAAAALFFFLWLFGRKAKRRGIQSVWATDYAHFVDWVFFMGLALSGAALLFQSRLLLVIGIYPFVFGVIYFVMRSYHQHRIKTRRAPIFPRICGEILIRSLVLFVLASELIFIGADLVRDLPGLEAEVVEDLVQEPLHERAVRVQGTATKIIRRAAVDEGGCDPDLIYALWVTESYMLDCTPYRGQPCPNSCCSYAGAKGPHQFMEGTWPTYAEAGWDMMKLYDSSRTACRMVGDDHPAGLGLQQETVRWKFQVNFTGMDGSLCWNHAVSTAGEAWKQAGEVWRIWQSRPVTGSAGGN